MEPNDQFVEPPAHRTGGRLEIPSLRRLVAIARQAVQHRAAGSVIKVVLLRGLAMAAQLGTGIVTAAALGPHGRGEVAAAIIVPPFLGAMALLGLQQSLIYHMKAEPARDREYLGAALLLGAASGIVAGVAGMLLVPLWLTGFDAETVTLVRSFALMAPFGVLVLLLAGALEARGAFGIATGAIYLQSFTALAALLGLHALGALDTRTAALAYVLPMLPTCLILGWFAWREVQPRLAGGFALRRRLLGYGLRCSGTDVLGCFSYYLDQLVVASMLGPRELGLYAVAFSLSRVLTALDVAVTTVLFPRIVARRAEGVVATVAQVVRLSAFGCGAVAAAIGLLAPLIIRLLYGEEFLPAVTPLRILLAEAVVTGATNVIVQAYNATGQPGRTSMLFSINIAVAALAMLVLVPAFGVAGAAAAALIGALVRLGCALAGIPIVLRHPLPRLVPGRRDFAWVLGR